jgi:hypothetical protein
MVNELKNQWLSVIDDNVEKKARVELNRAVRQYIRKDRKKFLQKIHQRWRKGLNYIHSASNLSKYGGDSKCSVEVVRLIECDGLNSNGEGRRMSMRVKVPEKKTLSAGESTQLSNRYTSASLTAAIVKQCASNGRKELLA